MTKEELAFSSFFMGEGCLCINVQRRKSGNRKGKNYGKKFIPWVRQVCKITLRQDDEKIIDWIKNLMGGSVLMRGYRPNVKNHLTGKITTSKPIIIWQTQSLEDCKRVCKLVIENPIPCKKKEEAKYMLEFLEYKSKCYKRGISYTEEQMQKFYYYKDLVSNLKKFKEK